MAAPPSTANLSNEAGFTSNAGSKYFTISTVLKAELNPSLSGCDRSLGSMMHPIPMLARQLSPQMTADTPTVMIPSAAPTTPEATHPAISSPQPNLVFCCSHASSADCPPVAPGECGLST